MKKFKRGRRVVQQIGYWVKWGRTYVVTGYAKAIPGPYRKHMGGARIKRGT